VDERGVPVASTISKQEIRRNPLAEWVGATVRFVQAYRRGVVAALVVLAIGASLGGGYWWQEQRKEDEASRLLAKAVSAIRGDQPGSPGNPDEASKALRQVVKEFPKTHSAEEALLTLGSVQYSAGKMDEALASFSEYLTAFPRGAFTVMAGVGKAYAQEAKGDLQGAAQTLSQVLERGKDDPLAGEAYMTLARLYKEMKKPDDAMRIYGQVVEKYAQTRWAQSALQRMNALKTK
jgi:predicted negative regulator of RcsB-dependent stress response